MRRLVRLLVLSVSMVGFLLPVSTAWTQQFDLRGSDQPPDFFGTADGAGEPVTVAAEFTAPTDGQPAGLFITATIQPGWHIYSITQPPGGPVRTTIKLEPSAAFRRSGAFRVAPPPEKKKEPVFDNLTVESHHGTVTWYAPLELAAGVDPARLQIRGELTVQPCDASACLPPRGIPFAAKLGRGVPMPGSEPAATEPVGAGIQDRTPSGVAPSDVAAQPPKSVGPENDYELPWEPFTTIAAFTQLTSDGTVAFDGDVTRQNLAAQHSGPSLRQLLLAVLSGFVGGIILNVMPCVLPVIGLKILSFVEQAGHDRRKALMLNVWYALGLLSVFVLLATLAVFVGLGWGQLFSLKAFNITLAAVVFVMGLSFLGVWEMPIPGFVGRGKASELAEKEGASGAFAKGILTTVLATPCSAPFLAPALTWTVAQPPLLTYVVFVSIGLGMASPYLLIGAFPGLIRFLPKPGDWMDTFKQMMGFVLMGTVVFIFTFLKWPDLIPAMGLLFGLWAACWWIGRTSPTADFPTRARAWAEAAAFAGVVWLIMFPGVDEAFPGRFSFGGLADVMQHRYEDDLEAEIAKVTGFRGHPGQNTVMIDFTADWCLTCKTLEATVLNTPEVRDAVERNGVVTLHADWTHAAPEVTEMLELLGSKQVPVLAIFPAGDPNRPIVLRGGYTQQTLLDALQKAGPSKRL